MQGARRDNAMQSELASTMRLQQKLASATEEYGGGHIKPESADIVPDFPSLSFLFLRGYNH